MEKRHYLEVSDANLTAISTFSRVVIANQVTGYNINGTTYNITGEEYNLLVTLPTSEPFKGEIAYSDATETWTKDGLYLHNSGTVSAVGFKKVYIKDFLELIPDSYQAKMINELTAGTINLNEMAEYLVNNIIYPKEFNIIYINDNQRGIQDQIVAYVNSMYYINSMNDYVPYQNTNNTYNSAWVISDTTYDLASKAAGLISNGFRKDMVLKSNKLIYLMSFDGMLLTDTTPYLGNTSLVYLNTVEIDSVVYQVYFNPKFLYSNTGFMTNPLIQSVWQTITIENAFIHSGLKGKVLKVW